MRHLGRALALLVALGAASPALAQTIELTPFHNSTNINQAIEVAKAAGLWILGTAEEASREVGEIPCDRSWLIVMGNEEQGLRRLVRERCDELCRISGSTGLTSLNVSVATGVVLGLMSRNRAGGGAASAVK